LDVLVLRARNGRCRAAELSIIPPPIFASLREQAAHDAPRVRRISRFALV